MVSLMYCPFLPLISVPFLAILFSYAHDNQVPKNNQQSAISTISYIGVIYYLCFHVILYKSGLTSFLSYQSDVNTHLYVQSLYVN